MDILISSSWPTCLPPCVYNRTPLLTHQLMVPLPRLMVQWFTNYKAKILHVWKYLYVASSVSPRHTTKHLHSGIFVLNCGMFIFRSGGLGNSVLRKNTLLPRPPLRNINMTQFKTKIPEWRCFVVWCGNKAPPNTSWLSPWWPWPLWLWPWIYYSIADLKLAVHWTYIWSQLRGFAPNTCRC